MKAFGYPATDTSKALNLTELSLCATPDEMRQIADFLVRAATDFETGEATSDHLHLSDHLQRDLQDNDLELVVFLAKVQCEMGGC